jgi:hypothetical protein
LLFVDLNGFLLGGGEDIDGLLVREDVFRVVEDVQYLIFDFFECLLVLG